MEEKGSDALEVAEEAHEEEEATAKSQGLKIFFSKTRYNKMDRISKEKLEKYFRVTGEALSKVKFKTPENVDFSRIAEDFLDMAQRYYEDAKHFRDKGDVVTAFAALNYAHGFLDAGARLGVFDVKDSRLFTVDE